MSKLLRCAFVTEDDLRDLLLQLERVIGLAANLDIVPDVCNIERFEQLHKETQQLVVLVGRMQKSLPPAVGQ